MVNKQRVLVMCVCACLMFAEACDRNNVNNCADNASCSIERTDSHGRRKRSFRMKESEFGITFPGDPCSFDTYDIDRNGVITRNELLDILGINQEISDLLTHLAVLEDDGDLDVQPAEFKRIVPRIITECSN